MSWAEDNGIDCWDLDDLEMNEQDEYEIIERWKTGFHETGKGKRISIKSMEDSHLANTISYFKNLEFDTSILEREVARREKLINKNFKI